MGSATLPGPDGKVSHLMPTDALYFEAARIVSVVSASKGTIKSLCFGSKYSNKKALFALVSETCKSMRFRP